MAISSGKLRNDPQNIAGARVLVAINYGADQLVSAAYAAAGGVESIAYCRGVLVTTAGSLVCVPAGQTDAVTLALEKGWHPLELSEVKSTSATVAGFYYW